MSDAMKLTVGQFKDGSLVLSCEDNGAEVDLVFASGAMAGDPQLDEQRAILDAIVATQVEHEAMRAEVERLREANEKFGLRQEWWDRKMFELEAQLKLNTDAYWDEVDRLTEKASLAHDRAEKAEAEVERLRGCRDELREIGKAIHDPRVHNTMTIAEWCDETQAELRRLKSGHCKDCCCARSWEALGITGYTGKSLPEEIEAIKAERDSLRADAERYRWLRSEGFDQPLPLASVVWKRDGKRNSWEWVNIVNPDALDALIDAARGES